MEPCLFRHGKKAIEPPTGEVPEELQWSHVFSDMVSLEALAALIVRRSASMEPCLFRHGKSVWITARPCSSRCFNGAMSFQTW